MRVGFLGLGVMGLPMARNLARRFPLIVWNRSASKYAAIQDTDASIAETPVQVAEQSDIIFIMLLDGPAIESILSDDFKRALRGKTIINSTSVLIPFSINLADIISDAGGDYIEMPVSGSKLPAEHGQLLGLIAGDPEVADRVRPFLKPITNATVYCGPVGSGLKAKYAVNTFATITAVGVAESMNFARAIGLDQEAFGQILNVCPMASAYSRMKVPKIQNEDWTPQATIKISDYSSQLIRAAAAETNTRLPLLQACVEIQEEAIKDGIGDEDMIAIVKTISKRSDA
ncbi:putative NAD binding NADP oxidoreductase coenzyme F420-dependent [Aspergillus pseudoustus]|uniref:NAD binding NADP oxidoreductase coenzyme F420-dependent n=1 Tax=Aspergillus pseudoustus TaxID=1810923 RepID=A0ABR4JGH3_9EURO